MIKSIGRVSRVRENLENLELSGKFKKPLKSQRILQISYEVRSFFVFPDNLASLFNSGEFFTDKVREFFKKVRECQEKVREFWNLVSLDTLIGHTRKLYPTSHTLMFTRLYQTFYQLKF